jgi:hypothetical protein
MIGNSKGEPYFNTMLVDTLVFFFFLLSPSTLVIIFAACGNLTSKILKNQRAELAHDFSHQ